MSVLACWTSYSTLQQTPQDLVLDRCLVHRPTQRDGEKLSSTAYGSDLLKSGKSFHLVETDLMISQFLANPQALAVVFAYCEVHYSLGRAWVTQETALASKVYLVARRQDLDMV